MSRHVRIRLQIAAMFVTSFATRASAQSEIQKKPAEVLIKNAVVMSVTHGNIQNGSIYIKDGRIAAVGKDLAAPPAATVIDAGARYLTPGITDPHSHIAHAGCGK